MKKDLSPDEQQRLMESLNSPKYKWRTIQGVTEETGLDADSVIGFLSNHPEIVQSSIPATSGESLFSTRAHFRETSSIAERVAGALKFRIS